MDSYGSCGPQDRDGKQLGALSSVAVGCSRSPSRLMEGKRIRLAMVVTHPIQYYVPLYRRLSLRDDLALKVFYTWHANPSQFDPGFQRDVHWDIPLTGGYDYQLLPNVAERPGSDHFFGIRNPELVDIVSLWRPDAVHITGYAYASHVKTIRAFHLQRVPVLFGGDSHLLDRRPGVRWEIKRFVLRQIFKWPSICLYVGKHNADYFHALGVAESRLCFCPHSIDVRRFAEPNDELENKAGAWRKKLGISAETKVLLFAGKFERKKCPLELMKAIEAIKDPNLLLIMVGSGELESEVYKIANRSPTRFRVLPFQNQSVMPIVYRLGDIFVLPSVRAETW